MIKLYSKKFFLFFLIFFLFFLFIIINTRSIGISNNIDDFGGGNGSEISPFIIKTPAHLDNIRDYLMIENANDEYVLQGYYFKLGNNIDLKAYIGDKWPNVGWEPIAHNYFSDYGTFIGHLDGNGYTISNLWIDRELELVGLFGSAIATIKNLKIELDSRGVNGQHYVGALAGYIQGFENYNLIENCEVIGDISLKDSKSNYLPSGVGGLFGVADNVKVLKCSYIGKISNINPEIANNEIGGIAGGMSSGEISNSYSKIEVVLDEITKTEYVGGIVGAFSLAIVITNCYAVINCNDYVFPILAGEENDYLGSSIAITIITNCYYNNDIKINPNPLIEKSFSNEIIPLSNNELYKQKSYKNWDFDSIWDIDENKDAPVLRYFLINSFPRPIKAWIIILIIIIFLLILFVISFILYWIVYKKNNLKTLFIAFKKHFVMVEIVEKPIFVDATPFPDSFTPREKEVALALLSGKNRNEVCKDLFISEGTLRKHIEHIYEKTGCTNRNEFISKYYGNK